MVTGSDMPAGTCHGTQIRDYSISEVSTQDSQNRPGCYLQEVKMSFGQMCFKKAVEHYSDDYQIDKGKEKRQGVGDAQTIIVVVKTFPHPQGKTPHKKIE